MASRSRGPVPSSIPLARTAFLAALLLAAGRPLLAQSIRTVAGGGTDDGRPATTAALYDPFGVSVDGSGNVLVADFNHRRLRRVDARSGVITTVAGNGAANATGDGGPATRAGVASPAAAVTDAAGNVFLSDQAGHRVRRVDAGSGVITTIAGTGTAGFSGDGGPATQAQLFEPTGLALSGTGLLVADRRNHRVRRVDLAGGTITTVAGTGLAGFAGDGGPATQAQLNVPNDVFAARDGSLYVADFGNDCVRRLDGATGRLGTVAGTCGSGGLSGDGGPATAARLHGPYGVAGDGAGSLYVGDFLNDRVRRVSGGVISTVAGGPVGGIGGDGGPATAALLSRPAGVAVDAAGALLVADSANQRVRRVDRTTGAIATIAGTGSAGYTGDGGPATAAGLSVPAGVARDGRGNLFVADTFAQRVRRVGPDGLITTIAGTGVAGFSGDGGPATAGLLADPAGVAADAQGNVFVADRGNSAVRRIDPSGRLSTVAGTGQAGFSGDGGPATAARLASPWSVAVDQAGNLFVADGQNHCVRRIALGTGLIDTVAGTPGVAGSTGDGGPATRARLNLPLGVAVEPSGDLLVSDHGNDRVRRVGLTTGLITAVAGNGTDGFGGDGGPATAAMLSGPVGVAGSPSGDVLVGDWRNRRVRRIAADGTISTFAGNGIAAFAGDDGPATPTGSLPGASLAGPLGVAVDAAGTLFLADGGANRVRAVAPCRSLEPPALVAPANGETGLATPVLSWAAVPGAFRYDVLLDTQDPPARVAASDLAGLSFSPLNLAGGTTFTWRVVAKGDPYCTPRATAVSASRAFKTAASCSTPSAPALSSPADGATGVAASPVLSWDAVAGAGSYDVAFGATDPPPPLASGVQSTSLTVPGLVPASTYFWAVTARASCDPARTATGPTRRFTVAGSTCLPPGAPALAGPADGAAGVAADVTFTWSAAAGATSYDLYLGRDAAPPLYVAGIRGTSLPVPGLAAGARLTWKVVARASCDPAAAASSPLFSFTVSGTCETPAAPAFSFVPPGSVGSGQTYAVAWSGGLSQRGAHVVQRSRTADFATVLDSQVTGASFATFVAPEPGPLHHRVRAVPACDPSRPGPFSAPAAIDVQAARPNVVFTLSPAATVAALGDLLEELSTPFVLENLSAEPVQVLVSRQELASVPFFRVVDPSGGDAAFVTLEPHVPRTLEVRFGGPPSGVAGSYQGLVVVSPTGSAGGLRYAFVNLKVGGSAGAVPEIRVGGEPSEYTYFPGFPSGQDDTARPPITVDVFNPGTEPMELGAEIGPEVWLVPEPGWNAQPIPPQGSRSVRLYARRARAPNGSALPRYTYLTLRTRDGQSARLLVQDNATPPVAPGRSGALHPSRRSLLVPSVVKATSRIGNTFVSRLRLANGGTSPVQLELDFTPAGADGFDPARVARAVVVVPPNDVATLTDPLVQLFGLTPPVAGSLEVRAAAEQIGLVTVASAVDAPSRSGGAFGFQMPVLVRGDGARAGSPQAVCGVVGNVRSRTNLILAETSGLDGAKVRVTLVDRSGKALGDTTVDVPRYGQRQLNAVADLLGGGDSFSGGRLEVEVVEGGGAVGAVTTVVDNVNDDASTYVGTPVSGSVPALAPALALGRSRAVAPPRSTVLVPAIVNGFATFPGTDQPYTFRSLVGLSSLTKEAATFDLRYDDLVSGERLTRSVTVPPRGTVELENVVEELFGLAPGTRSQGPLLVDADLNGLVYCKVYSDLGSGALGDAFPVVPVPSEGLTGAGSGKPLLVDGLEQSVDRGRGTRSNLILNEVSGLPVTVRVQLYEAGNRSVPIAARDVPLAPWEKVQLSTVFAELGLDTAARRKDRTNVQLVVTPVSGAGLVSGVVTTIDNRTGDTRNAALVPGGGPPGDGVGIGR